MKIVVIGGTGHIGTHLVPRLVRAGHHVVNISRGTSRPYGDGAEWEQVEHVVADREDEDRSGVFGERVAHLQADAVVDLVCFTLASADQLVTVLRGSATHLLHCGSLWRYGPSLRAPITEESGTQTRPFGEYGIAKDAIARMLKAETAAGALATTSLHPGHIVGAGWHPIGPLGNVDPTVWRTLSGGRPLQLPGSGAELMHHVHADDVAQAFEGAIAHRDAAAGEDFNVGAPTALSVRGFAEIAAGWFGQPLTTESVSWEEFRSTTSPEHAESSWNHLSRSHCMSIAKARTLLGYSPRYQAEDAVRESIGWLIDRGQLPVVAPLRG